MKNQTSSHVQRALGLLLINKMLDEVIKNVRKTESIQRRIMENGEDTTDQRAMLRGRCGDIWKYYKKMLI